MSPQSSLVDELEDAIKNGSRGRRVATLRRITDLFLNQAEQLNEAQVSVFDDVLCHFVDRIDAKALVELSSVLAPLDNAPTQVIRRLARNDDIGVAGPILSKSSKLTSDDLIEIAGTKSQAHLAAIAERSTLETAVTDVLVVRGDRNVKQRLADNAGARFSDRGYAYLVESAASDEALAKTICLRIDLPPALLQTLLDRATQTVREWILASAPPGRQESIGQTLLAVAGSVGREASAPRDFSWAMRTIEAMKAEGNLTEDALLTFALTEAYEEMVVALAALCSVPVNLIIPLIKSPRMEGLLLACRAAGLKWPTTSAILNARIAHHRLTDSELSQTRTDYLKLSAETARRTLRFWSIRVETKWESASKADRTATSAAPAPGDND